MTREQNKNETRKPVDTMSDSNSINRKPEKEKPMKAVVECTSDAQRVRRKEVISEGSD